MSQLSDVVYAQIQALCESGDAFAQKDEFAAALKQYWSAWDLLPEPRIQWQSATWILGAIGDANFLNGDFEAGRDNLSLAMHCPDAIGNPFLHLRLGQCQYELGNLELAADELTRAYMGGGAEIYAEEERYFDFLKTKLKPPADGW
jgi:hypothetical protein